jgi:hypothetical protein
MKPIELFSLFLLMALTILLAAAARSRVGETNQRPADQCLILQSPR